MIGFRGASRYIHPAYAEGFALECEAMKYVREVMGLTNVILMIPFCRRVGEGEKVLEYMAQFGLKRGEKGLQVYVMCEIPNNVIQIDAFAQHFDGCSIGSNDLTQLTLGVDRDSEIVAADFDERDPGVKEMIRLAVAGARRNGRHSGLCGQVPSDYPEMAEFLVEIGIDPGRCGHLHLSAGTPGQGSRAGQSVAVRRDGKDTGARPGKVARNSRAACQAHAGALISAPSVFVVKTK